MGLGVALTGFLTGFAKQATAEIETRNKELRDSIDRQIEEHKKKVQLSIEEKKKLRKDMRERHGDLAGIFDTLGKEFSYGQMAYVISSDERAAQFKNLTKQFNLSTADGRQEIINAVQLGKNSPKFDSLDDAIELTTQVEKVAEPVVVSTRTAFGLPSNIQQRRLDAAKQAAPQLFEQPKDSVRLRGSIMPKFTPDTASIKEKTVFNQITSGINSKVKLTEIPGVKNMYLKVPEVGEGLGEIQTIPGKVKGTATPAQVRTAFQEAGLSAVKEYVDSNKGSVLTNSQMQGINSALLSAKLKPIAFTQTDRTVPIADVKEALENIAIDPIDTKRVGAQEFKEGLNKQEGGSRFQKQPPKKDPVITTPTTKTEEITDILRQISMTTPGSKTRNLLIDRLRTFGFNSPNEAMAFLKQQ